ncbi:hypothetical protein EPUL_003041, partial [Erysiphe pulchra]
HGRSSWGFILQRGGITFKRSRGFLHGGEVFDAELYGATAAFHAALSVRQTGEKIFILLENQAAVGALKTGKSSSSLLAYSAPPRGAWWRLGTLSLVRKEPSREAIILPFRIPIHSRGTQSASSLHHKPLSSSLRCIPTTVPGSQSEGLCTPKYTNPNENKLVAHVVRCWLYFLGVTGWIPVWLIGGGLRLLVEKEHIITPAPPSKRVTLQDAESGPTNEKNEKNFSHAIACLAASNTTPQPPKIPIESKPGKEKVSNSLANSKLHTPPTQNSNHNLQEQVFPFKQKEMTWAMVARSGHKKFCTVVPVATPSIATRTRQKSHLPNSQHQNKENNKIKFKNKIENAKKQDDRLFMRLPTDHEWRALSPAEVAEPLIEPACTEDLGIKSQGVKAHTQWANTISSADICAFLDGSSEGYGCFAWGFVLQRGGVNIERGRGILHEGEVFDAEFYGATVAFHAALSARQKGAKIFILLSNQAVLRALKTGKSSSSLSPTRTFYEVAKRANAEVRWVPGHSNIMGNVEADAQARAALRMLPERNISPSYMTLAYLRRLMHQRQQILLDDWWSRVCQSHYQDLDLQMRLNKPPELSLPRRLLRHLIAARTGHGDFAAYHYRFKYSDAIFECYNCNFGLETTRSFEEFTKLLLGHDVGLRLRILNRINKYKKNSLAVIVEDINGEYFS